MTVPNSATIDHSNIFSQSHANIFNLINDRNNVADPTDIKGNRKMVYVREPKTMGRGFDDYPIIVIPPADIDSVNLTASATKSTVTSSITIRVYTIDARFPAKSQAPGASQLDTLSNSIIQTLNNSSNRTTLRNRGMKNLQIISYPADYEELSNQMIFIREFEINYSQILTVTT